MPGHAGDAFVLKTIGDIVKTTVDADNSVSVGLLQLFDGLIISGAVEYVLPLAQNVFDAETDSDLLRKVDNHLERWPIAHEAFRLSIGESAIATIYTDLATSAVRRYIRDDKVRELSAIIAAAEWLDTPVSQGAEPGGRYDELASSFRQSGSGWFDINRIVQVLLKVLDDRLGDDVNRVRLRRCFGTTSYLSFFTPISRKALLQRDHQNALGKFNFRRIMPTTALELAINDRGEPIIFTDNPLFMWRWMDLVIVHGTQMDFVDPRSGYCTYGVPLRPELRDHIETGARPLLVHSNENGEPLGGDYKTAIIMD
jgi:hypothetical protein